MNPASVPTDPRKGIRFSDLRLFAAMWYLASMSPRAMSVRLIQAALLSSGISSYASEMVSNPPVALVTNVVAQRVVGDVIQALLTVTPADKP